MKYALWIVQALLAAAFLMAGGMKATAPIDQLAANGMTWVADMPGLVRFIGVAEFAGALGLILPALTRIKPWLTPLAAAALALVMLLATGYHVSRGEPMAASAVLMGLALFVAYGRTKLVPIAPKGGKELSPAPAE